MNDNETFRHGIIPQGTPMKRAKINSRILKDSVARGKILFIAKCASCHGVDGKGTIEAKKMERHPPDLSKLVQEVPNFTFFLSISQWSGQMPGWKDKYSELDREDLVNYIKTFGKH